MHGTCTECARVHSTAAQQHSSNNDSDSDPDPDPGSDYDTRQVASRAAAALGASKLIFLSYSRLMTRTAFLGNATANYALASQQPASYDGEIGLRQVQSMRLGDAKRLVQERAEALELAEESCNVALEDDGLASCTVASVLALCGHCVGALEQGVTRAHLVPPVGGALLKELYTLDGIGTLLSRDLYDGIRRAVPEDTPGIIELIQPLEKQVPPVPLRRLCCCAARAAAPRLRTVRAASPGPRYSMHCPSRAPDSNTTVHSSYGVEQKRNRQYYNIRIPSRACWWSDRALRSRARCTRASSTSSRATQPSWAARCSGGTRRPRPS